MGQLGQGGKNLFQSFDRFDLGADEIAVFEGPASVRNIVTRVTGGSPSFLDGTLRSDIEGSSLYFLNPAGVMFGPSANLDLPGSFYASTAQQLRLDDGSVFDARAGGAVPLLSTASPQLFGFLNAEGPITIAGGPILQIPRGTLGFIGGDVRISGQVFEGEIFRSTPGG